MICTDCNGKKVYVGLGHYNERTPCGRCGGSGQEPNQPSGMPLRDYQKEALTSKLAERALWTGHAEVVTAAIVSTITDNLTRFPGRVYLPTTSRGERFSGIKYSEGALVRTDDERVYWLLLGSRKVGGAMHHYQIAWRLRDKTRRDMMDYASIYYLTLYQRIEMKNEFKCIWHY